MVCQKTFKNKLLIFCLVFAFCFSPMVVHAAEHKLPSDSVVYEPSYMMLIHNGNFELRDEDYKIFPSFSGSGFQTFKIPGQGSGYLRGWVYVQTIVEFEKNDSYGNYDRYTIDLSCDRADVEIFDYHSYMMSEGKYRLSYYLQFYDAVTVGENFWVTVGIDMNFSPSCLSSEAIVDEYECTITSETIGCDLTVFDSIEEGATKEAGIAGWLKGIKENTYGIWVDLNAGIQSVVGKLQELINSMNILLFGTGTGSSTSLSEGGGLIGESNSLQEQQNQLQSEGNVLQEEANTLQEEANETQKNIFDKIADFFDNFFSRLGEFLLGLIVPSAEELTTFLDEVNAWFSDRLGFIWYPFSFAIDMVSALAGGSADTGFKVPGFSLNILGTEYQIWSGMTVDMDAFGIFRYVRIFTSFLLVGGIVKLAYDKWDEWIGGHGVG